MDQRSEEGVLRAIVGPTASGKTALAVAVARAARQAGTGEVDTQGPWEILSLDSMLVYRGLDLGTAKPALAEQGGVPHRLLDLVEPTERYDVARYLADARAAEAEVRASGGTPLFAGGTALYLQALLFGLMEGPPVDHALRAELEGRYATEGPEALHAELAAGDADLAARLHPNDRKRVVRGLEVLRQTGRPLSDWQREWSGAARPARLVGLDLDPARLDERITARTRAMLAAGWPEEARRLRAAGALGPTAVQALGYAEVLALVDGELTEAECVERVALRTRQFARRQRTWLRRFEGIRWFPAPGTTEDLERLAPQVLEWLAG